MLKCLLIVIVVVAVVAGGVFAVNTMRARAQREEIVAVRKTEECLARFAVANFSGIRRIDFDGYSYNMMAGDTAYSSRLNGIDNMYIVDGKPSGTCDISSSSEHVKNSKDFDDGWFGGDRAAGIRLRDKALPESQVSLDDIAVSYSTRKLEE